MSDFWTNTIIGILAAIGLVVIVAAIMILPTYYLWNWLMPTIFNLPKLTLWQALGINLLAGTLIKNTNWKK